MPTEIMNEMFEFTDEDLQNEVARVRRWLDSHAASDDPEYRSAAENLDRLEAERRRRRQETLLRAIYNGTTVIADGMEMPEDEELWWPEEETIEPPPDEDWPDAGSYRAALDWLRRQRQQELEALALEQGLTYDPEGDLADAVFYESEKQRLSGKPPQPPVLSEEDRRELHRKRENVLRTGARDMRVAFTPQGDLSDNEQYDRETARLIELSDHKVVHATPPDNYAAVSAIDKILRALEILLGSDKVSAEIKAQLAQFLEPANFASFVTILAGFMALQAAGGPFAWFGAALGLIALFVAFGTTIFDLAEALYVIGVSENRQEFDRGVDLLARAFGKLGADFFVTLLTIGLGKVASAAKGVLRGAPKAVVPPDIPTVPRPPVSRQIPPGEPVAPRRVSMPPNAPPPRSVPPEVPPVAPPAPVEPPLGQAPSAPRGRRLPVVEQPPRPSAPKRLPIVGALQPPSPIGTRGRRLPVVHEPLPPTRATPMYFKDERAYMDAWAKLVIPERSNTILSLMKQRLSRWAVQFTTIGLGVTVEAGPMRAWVPQTPGPFPRLPWYESGEARIWLSSTSKYIPNLPWFRLISGERLVPHVKKIAGFTRHHAEQQLLGYLKNWLRIGATKPICPHCAGQLHLRKVPPGTGYARMGLKKLRAFLKEIGLQVEIQQKHLEALRRLYGLDFF